MAAVRIVVVVDAFGPELGADAAAAAVAAGWHAAAPDAQLTVVAPAEGVAAGVFDGADLAVTGGASFDWQTLRDSLITEVAGAAVARGVPCVVFAGQVSVGRREAAAVGVDAAYALDGPTGISEAALVTLAERVARRWNR